MIHAKFGHVFSKLVVSCLAVSAVSLVPDGEVYAQDLESRFRKEAPIGWKLLREKHRQTIYRWDESRSSDGKEMKRTVSGSNAYRGDNFLITVKKQDGTTVYGGNEIYNFSVRRRSEDDPWLLIGFGQREKVSLQADELEYGALIRVPWALDLVPCLDLIGDPSFEIKSIIEKPDGVVELEFSVDPIGSSQIRPGLTSGRISFLPDDEWAISSYEVELTYKDASSEPVTLAASADYGPPQKDFINLRHVTYEMRWKSQGKLRSNRWETDIVSERSKEAKDSFRLSTFGLDAPEMLSGKRWSRWVIFIGGFASLFFAVLLVRMFNIFVKKKTGIV